MHDLARWMDTQEPKETDESLAAKLSISRVQVTRIRNGTSGASKKTALELEGLTGIPWYEFIEPATEPPARSAEHSEVSAQ